MDGKDSGQNLRAPWQGSLGFATDNRYMCAGVDPAHIITGMIVLKYHDEGDEGSIPTTEKYRECMIRELMYIYQCTNA